MKNILLYIVISIITVNVNYSQKSDSLPINTKNGISKPSILSVHPFGIFSSRLQGNFKVQTTKNTQISFSLESGNVWGTPITTYIPNDETIRNGVREHEWHQAQYFYDEETLDAQSYQLQIDGVIKGLRINTSFKLAQNQELNLGARLFMLTKGKAPFSIFTSDDFIENFHNEVAGGSDPFDRGVFGHNKALIKYIDRNGNDMTIEANDFLVGGLETAYYYYPESLGNKTLKFNFGAHLGVNLSPYNQSVDLGVSANSVKQIFFRNKRRYFNLGLNLGVLRKNLVDFKSDNLDFGTNDFLANLETALEFNLVSKGNTTHSFGANYYFQTRLNKKDELEYIIPIRHPDAHNSWGHGVTNLYKTNNYWTFIYTFTRKTSFSVYFQQDFQVNNNPDIQTGISFSFGID